MNKNLYFRWSVCVGLLPLSKQDLVCPLYQGRGLNLPYILVRYMNDCLDQAKCSCNLGHRRATRLFCPFTYYLANNRLKVPSRPDSTDKRLDQKPGGLGWIRLGRSQFYDISSCSRSIFSVCHADWSSSCPCKTFLLKTWLHIPVNVNIQLNNFLFVSSIFMIIVVFF